MSAHDDLLARARRLLDALEGLKDEVTVVGGTSPALYGLPASVSVRPTRDIDLVIAPTQRMGWHRFVRALEDRGFVAASEPICRYTRSDLVLDVMTTSEEPLGFTNRWYGEGVRRRIKARGVDLFVLDPLYFVATKLDAWESRGGGDPYSSHDLEDIFVVARGVTTLIDDIGSGEDEVHVEIRRQLGALCRRDDALDIVRAHLEPDAATQALGPRLLDALRVACRVKS